MSALALLGGEKAKNKPFPTWPHYDEAEEGALKQVLESRIWWRTPGTKTLEFEQAFARFHGARHGIAVTNGTAALEVTMAGLGIGTGDEVILPDFTFVATASAVLFANALPVLVDVDPETYCINPDLVEEAITPRTKAVITVHMGGHPADLDRLKRITDRKKLAVIEDSSHAHVERQARSVHDCGRMPGEWFYSHFIYGSNYRLSEWQGAVLQAQLGRLDEQTKVRHRNARLLDRLLGKIPGIPPQKLDDRCTRNGQYAYIFHVNKKEFAGIATDRFIAAMNAEGIPNQASYPPLHQLHMFRNGEYRKRLCGKQAKERHAFLKRRFPVTQRAAWETVWIPQPALLGDEEDVEEMAASLSKIQKHAKDLA